MYMTRPDGRGEEEEKEEKEEKEEEEEEEIQGLFLPLRGISG